MSDTLDILFERDLLKGKLALAKAEIEVLKEQVADWKSISSQRADLDDERVAEIARLREVFQIIKNHDHHTYTEEGECSAYCDACLASEAISKPEKEGL